MINRLKQVIAEDEYSRRNIREKVMTAIKAAKEDQLKEIFDDCANSLDQWLMNESKYTAKDYRKVTIAAKGIENVVIELFIAVMLFEGKTPIQAVAAKLSSHLGFEDTFEGVLAASEILAVCWNRSLYKMHKEPLQVEPQLRLPVKIREFIKTTQYLNPMVSEPKEWLSNINGGYITICEHVILGRHNNHRENQALDALNIMQSIEWELDDVAVNYVEKPKHILNTDQKKIAWQQHIDMSTKVYQEMMDTGNSFWFPWKYDFRGRMYSQGYYINFQSTGYKKSILNFKHRELIV